MRRIIAIVLTMSLAACDTGEVVSTSNVRMTVEDRKNSRLRFWFTIVGEDGSRWRHVRLGGKRCRRGPRSLPVGREIMAGVQRVRFKDGRTSVRLDTADLRRRFC